MQNETLQSKWVEIKKRIEAKWGKFSKAEIESVRGNLDDLAVIIQRVYGYARGRAERECHEFQISLRQTLHSSGFRKEENL